MPDSPSLQVAVVVATAAATRWTAYAAKVGGWSAGPMAGGAYSWRHEKRKPAGSRQLPAAEFRVVAVPRTARAPLCCCHKAAAVPPSSALLQGMFFKNPKTGLIPW